MLCCVVFAVSILFDFVRFVVHLSVSISVIVRNEAIPFPLIVCLMFAAHSCPRISLTLSSRLQVNAERRQQEAAERALMAKEEVVSMAVEQVVRSDEVLQSKLAALKRDRIRAEAGELRGVVRVGLQVECECAFGSGGFVFLVVLLGHLLTLEGPERSSHCIIVSFENNCDCLYARNTLCSQRRSWPPRPRALC